MGTKKKTAAEEILATEETPAAEGAEGAEAPALLMPIINGHAPPPGFVERAGEFVPFKTAEEWARAKGMYPQFISVVVPFARADARPVQQHNPQFWKFSATKAGSAWPEGKELTEAEFDAAVTQAITGHKYS